MILLDYNILNNIKLEILISLCTILVSIIGGYIVIRERILKTELKNEALVTYVDSENKAVKAKIEQVEKDVTEFKDTNKEMQKSLVENTGAIRELKIVLELIREQMGVKASRRIKKSIENE